MPEYNPANRDWVEAANDRIERERKGKIMVNVDKEKFGDLSKTHVSVNQLSHSFSFGSAVAAKRIFDESTDGEKYRDIVESHFNEVVLENDLKWPNWKNSPGKSHVISH